MSSKSTREIIDRQVGLVGDIMENMYDVGIKILEIPLTVTKKTSTDKKEEKSIDDLLIAFVDKNFDEGKRASALRGLRTIYKTSKKE